MFCALLSSSGCMYSTSIAVKGGYAPHRTLYSVSWTLYLSMNFRRPSGYNCIAAIRQIVSLAGNRTRIPAFLGQLADHYTNEMNTWNELVEYYFLAGFSENVNPYRWLKWFEKALCRQRFLWCHQAPTKDGDHLTHIRMPLGLICIAQGSSIFQGWRVAPDKKITICWLNLTVKQSALTTSCGGLKIMAWLDLQEGSQNLWEERVKLLISTEKFIVLVDDWVL